MEAKLPGRIGASGHHSSLIGPPPHRKNFPPQRWIVLLLNRTEKGIKIDMQDFARTHRLFL
jgi:hypothetical protein